MKRLLTICAVAGFILITTGLATADDLTIPPWAGQPRTVFAEWDDWDDFPSDMPPVNWFSNPPGLPDPCANAETEGDTAELLPTYAYRDDVIKLTADGDLVFKIPNFPLPNDCKKIWIQVTYHPTDPNQHPWFDVEAEGIEGMTDPVLEDRFDEWSNDWVTEAWSFQIQPNPESEEITLNFFDIDDGTPSYPAYVDQVVIDTWCVPEPTTVCLLGLGSLVFLRKRRA